MDDTTLIITSLKQDALILDSTNMSIEEVFNTAMDYIKSKQQ